jgi:rRNA maturation RNase YbeY
MAVHFAYDGVRFRLKGSRGLKNWLTSVVNSHNKRLGRVHFVFVSDERLLEINQLFLNHDYYTDIITFDYCDHDLISGEIYISVDRVLENSDSMNIVFDEEILRVLAHGVLHLVGFKDETIAMRGAEDKAVSLRHSSLLVK